MSDVHVIDMVAASAPSPPPPALPGRFLLLIVDPHEAAAGLAEEVGAVGVETLVCADPAEALLQVGIAQPDAVLLAPDISPLDTIAVVRALTRRSSIPVLVGLGDSDGRSAAEALTAGALAQVTRIMEGLQVDTARMRRNLDVTHGLVTAEAVSAALAPKLGREAAHGLVEAACRRAIEQDKPLREVLADGAEELPIGPAAGTCFRIGGEVRHDQYSSAAGRELLAFGEASWSNRESEALFIDG